jgi:Subtilase family/Proprotein convertase P-domain
MTDIRRITLLSPLAAALAISSAMAAAKEPQPALPGAMSAKATAQIQALLAAKDSWSPVERKLGSQLVAGLREQKGIAFKGAPAHLRSAAKPEADGTIVVDVRGFGAKAVAAVVRKVGGSPLYLSDREQMVRARLPFAAIETLATSGIVRSVRPSAKAAIADAPLGRKKPSKAELTATLRPGFERRADRVRTRLGAILATGSGSIVSEGVAAHQADQAEDLYGATGAGIKVGVLSDSVDFLADVQAAGELPAVTVLQDIVPSGTGSGEGTAMLEIVHDMAPGAELFFASAFNGEDSFADNISALRAAGCDIIVDDVFYYDESPFQDGPVAAAVDSVTKDGALYFSSAGNQGNLDDGTTSVWEGNFKSAKVVYQPLTPFGYTLHDFGNGNISNLLLSGGPYTFLFWNEVYDKSKVDYDLFVVDTNLQEVVDASFDTQNGDDLPIEAVVGPFAGERLIVAKPKGAPSKRIHLNAFGGFIGIGTAGQTHGHSAAINAYSVAAVAAADAQGGAFTGGQQNPVEYFSSDGPRQIYFNSDGRAAVRVRKKPDIAAADGVQTATPGFNPFFGTSAAAPHAAGVAALVKQLLPTATTKTIRRLLTTSALDIEQKGADRNSGAGIVMAVDALQKGKAKVIANPHFNDAVATAGTPDGDAYVEPGESATLAVEIVNVGGASATGVSATLSTITPGVTIDAASSTYPDIAPGITTANTTPFAFTLDAGDACGLTIESQLDVTYAGGPGPTTFNFNIQTGQPGVTPDDELFTGPSVAIPDDDSAGVDIPFPVSGLTRIADVNFSFDGSSCDTDPANTANGLNHSYVGDLIVKLTSPQGTTVTLLSRPGGGTFGSSGNNFCGTVLDDDGAGPSIDGISAADAPYSGSYLPHEALSAFDGQDPNGTWILNVSDNFSGDTGGVNAFTLSFTGFDCN